MRKVGFVLVAVCFIAVIVALAVALFTPIALIALCDRDFRTTLRHRWQPRT